MWKKKSIQILGDITAAVFSGDDVGDFYGFVYNITNLQNERQYIGAKVFLGKNESLDLKIQLSREKSYI